MIHNLILLALCFKGHRRMYEDKVPEFIISQMKKNTGSKIKSMKNKANKLKANKMVEIGSYLATDSELAQEMIDNGLMDGLLEVFKDDDYPNDIYLKCVTPFAVFSKVDVGKIKLAKEMDNGNFNLRRFAVKLDEIAEDKPMMEKQGIALIKNLATEKDLDEALKGLDLLNEDDITFFAYLALCDNLLPIMVEKDIIKKLLDVLERLCDKKPLKVKAIANCVKVLKIICQKHSPSIDRFMELDGFKVVSKLLDLKEMPININLCDFSALVLDKGPDTVTGKMVEHKCPKKLCLFWEDTPPYIYALREQYTPLKKFFNNCIGPKAPGPTNDKEMACKTNYDMLNNLMKSGFFLFEKLSARDPKLFDEVTPEFHKACAVHLDEFTDNSIGQNCGLEFMARLEYPEDCIRALIQNNFIEALFKTKMQHIDWHYYGLNSERVLDKICYVGQIFINHLKDKKAYRVVVATLHFLHDDDFDEKDGKDGFVEDDDNDDLDFGDDEEDMGQADTRDWTKLSKKEEAECVKLGYDLLENIHKLLEIATFKEIQSSLGDLIKKCAIKVVPAIIPEIRIELATLAVMNMIPRFGMDSLKNNHFTNAYTLTDKVSEMKKFNDQDKILADGIKCYTSYISLTDEPYGFEEYDDKNMGPKYFTFNNKVLKKNKDAPIAIVFLRGLANGLEQRYNILRAAKADKKPKLTRGDSILGIRGITPGDAVDEASNNCTRMMNSFPDNEKVLYFGAKAIRYLARLAVSSKDNLNKNGVGKMLTEALSMPWRMATHAQIVKAIDALAEDDGEAVATLSKQRCLASIMNALARHDGDEELVDAATPAIDKLAENKDEIVELKNQLEYHMGRIKTYNANFDTPSKEQ